MMAVLHWFWHLPSHAVIGFVRLYQWTLGPFLGGRCRFEPSCSEYMIAAVQKYGAFVGAEDSPHALRNGLAAGAALGPPRGRAFGTVHAREASVRQPASSLRLQTLAVFELLLPGLQSLEEGLGPLEGRAL